MLPNWVGFVLFDGREELVEIWPLQIVWEGELIDGVVPAFVSNPCVQ